MKNKDILLKQILKTSAIFLVLIVQIFIPKKVLAQEFKEDYKKVMKSYYDHHNILQEMTYTLYPDGREKGSLLVKKGIFKQNGKNTYCSYFDLEDLETDKYSLQLDHKRKYIFLTEKTAKQRRHEKKWAGPSDLSSVLKSIDSSVGFLQEVKYLGLREGLKTYQFRMPSTHDRWIRLSIDPESYFIKKIVVFSNHKITVCNGGKVLTEPRAEIEYSNIQVNPKWSEKDFSIKTYVKITGNHFTTNEAYKKYKLFFTKL